MHNQENLNKKSKKSVYLRLIVLIVEIIVIIILYAFLAEFGANPLIIVLILIFIFLTFAGPLLKKKQGSLYAEMFPDKNKVREEIIKRKKEDGQKREEMRLFNLRHKNKINLDVKYTKPIIRKCEKCGMIVPKFTKKCPICGNKMGFYKKKMLKNK